MHERRAFYLLPPEDLPRSRDDCVAHGDAAAALAIVGACAAGCSEASALTEAGNAIARLDLDPRSLIPVGADPHESDGNRSNDEAFGIVRVRGDVTAILVHSTLHGFVALLEEAIAGGTNVSAEDWGKLRSAFALLFHILKCGSVDGFATLDSGAAPLAMPPAAEEQHSALSRWIRGHHMFMVLIQGLVTSFSSFQREVQAGRIDQARDSLRAATCLMVASGVALRFTGDFKYSAYEREVRPTLMPPIAPEGLTGLYWRDHEYLIAFLTKARALFTSLDPSLREQLHSFHEALKETYDSHKVVCASFVGTERPSLLMATRTQKSAVETLDHFKRVRLNLVQD
jgi:hypothetical protein